MRPWMIRMWLVDHGADWFQRIGDGLGRPFHQASGWCNRRFWGDYNHRDRREYRKVFGP